MFASRIASLLIMTALAACSSPPREYAAQGLAWAEGESPQRADIDDVQVRQVMQSAASGYAASERPSPAKYGVRWSDISNALYWAGFEVEMAPFRSYISEDLHVYEMRTIDGVVGELRIRRTFDERVYEADAQFGWRNERTDLAESLLAAFDDQMTRFGAKRGFEDA